jgi:hypothetical protein
LKEHIAVAEAFEPFFAAADGAAFATYPDLDMMPIGDIIVGGRLAPSRFLPSEARLLVTLSQQGDEVRASAKVCGMRIEGSKLVRTSIPPALVRAMPEQRWQSKVSATEGRLELAPWARWDVLGARLQEPSRDALPTEASDARVFDQDGDGKPGVTVAVRGMIDGEIFVTQKGWSELRPDRVTADSISGSVRWRQTQTILGASSRFLSSGPETRPDPKPAANWFSARRVEAGASCAEVSALPASFFRR